MKRVLKIVGSAVGIIFILVALDVLGILGLSYPAAVKNNPLIKPVRINSEKIDTLLCNILSSVFSVFMLV